MIGAPATVNVIALGPVGVIAPVDVDSSSPVTFNPFGPGGSYAATAPTTITVPITFGAIAGSPEQIADAYAYASTISVREFVSVSDPGEPPGLQLGGSAAYVSTEECS